MESSAGRCDAQRGAVVQHLEESAQVKQAFAGESADQVLACARLIVESLRRGGKLMLCGNGGSAADCQHIAAEYVSILSQTFNRPALAALALTTDTSYLTARANDYGVESLFSRQVEALGKPVDVLVGISTSGNSVNVLKAFDAARKLGIGTIGMTGRSGGKMIEAADLVLRVPSDCVQYIQECHLSIGHIIVALVERDLFQ